MHNKFIFAGHLFIVCLLLVVLVLVCSSASFRRFLLSSLLAIVHHCILTSISLPSFIDDDQKSIRFRLGKEAHTCLSLECFYEFSLTVLKAAKRHLKGMNTVREKWLTKILQRLD